MKFIDFFAGIGGFHSGMELAGHQCVGYVEWDKFARQSYEAIYDTEGMYTAYDITKIKNGNELPKSDVWCFGSPCTNISLAGNREGLHGSASSMFFEVMRLLRDREEVHRPAYLFMENVKNLLSSNGGRDFAEVIIQMDEVGYDVEWQVLNSKEVIPQNRERIFIVGHKRNLSTQKVFPVNLTEYQTKYNILADVLEQNADEKYYLDERRQKLFRKRFKQADVDKDIKIVSNVKSESGTRQGTRSRVFSDEGVSPTLTATDYKEPQCVVQIANLGNQSSFGGNPQTGRVYGAEELSPTLNTIQDGERGPKVVENEKVYPCLTPDRINKRQNGRRFKDDGDPMFTITAADRHGVAIKKTYGSSWELKNGNVTNTQNLRVRKLTPLECWRLQGFSDEQFNKAKNSGVSNSQLYKQAGNAVTVPIIHAIADKFKYI